MRNVNTLLFDLGGVLIELGSMEEMMASSPFDHEEIWQSWIRSSSVRKFESGRTNENEFAADMIVEFQLDISGHEFMQAFRAWPKGVFDGACELLEQLSSHYRLVCLSNTNPAHYEGFLRDETLMQFFDDQFLSHHTGMLKPDKPAFENVLRTLDIPADEILFFDDHAGNIAAARALGFRAERVDAPSGVLDRMRGLGLPN
jgi:putative hydrolase of the HAD superfamily